MSDEDEAARLLEQRTREAAEAAFISNRISELHEDPIKGNFDTEHLKAIHAYIFDGYSEHQPGVVREDTGGWIKTRVLEGYSSGYVVHYAGNDVESKLTETLDQFGGAKSIKGLTADAAAESIAKLYGDLDHAHGFYEGNSRTLREFTRELAKEAGFNLDWTGTSVSEQQRNELYMARDLAVMERAFPDLTPAKAMQTNDRAEFEASFVIEALRNDVGNKTLAGIIRDSLSPDIQIDRSQERNAQSADLPELRPEQGEVLTVTAAPRAPQEEAQASEAQALGEPHQAATDAISDAGQPRAAETPPATAETSAELAQAEAAHAPEPDPIAEFLRAEQGDREERKQALQELAKSLGRDITAENSAGLSSGRARGGGQSL